MNARQLGRFSRVLGLLAGIVAGLFASLGLGKAQALAPAQELQEKQADAAQVDEQAELGQTFLRLREENGQRFLEAATLTLRAPDGQAVYLVGAIHLAEEDYYAQLNEQFQAYEVLLFELLVDENQDLEAQLKAMAEGDAANEMLEKSPEGQALGMLKLGQVLMGQLFALSFQTQEIDYLAENFVHADMSLQQFMEAQKEANESFTSAMMKKVEGLEEELEIDEEQLNELIKGLFRGETEAAKLFLAEILVEFTNALGRAEDSPESVLLQGRNAVALEALAEQIQAGKQKIGIYYGAAHLPHLLQELTAQGYDLEGVRWLTAWKMEGQN